MVGNDDNLLISRIEDIYFRKNLNIKDVFVVPKLKKNLISIGKLLKDNEC